MPEGARTERVTSAPEAIGDPSRQRSALPRGDRMKRHPELATPTIGVTKEEIVELFIHVEAYAGAARAFDSYQVAKDVFAETAE